jgi:hypothetical protein
MFCGIDGIDDTPSPVQFNTAGCLLQGDTVAVFAPENNCCAF